MACDTKFSLYAINYDGPYGTSIVCKSLPIIGILLLTKKGISLHIFPMCPSGVSYLYETSLKRLPFSLGMTFALSIY